MLKMYHTGHAGGNTTKFWEDNWANQEFYKSVRFCASDPLRPLFTKYAKTNAWMLEGGCGIGNYVEFYTAKGVNVVGLDFAQNTLNRIRAQSPRLMLCAGDVSALPFEDSAFDLYYSGGVVEHFESGPEAALREAYRILKPGGVFLISVPYLSPLRRFLRPFRKNQWKIVDQERSEVCHGNQFFQYAYTQREFKQYLNQVGFRVISMQGYAIVFGIYDFPLAQRLGRFLESRLQSKYQDSMDFIGTTTTDVNDRLDSTENHQMPTLKRLVVCEDESVPVVGNIIRFMRWTCANMMMYVCLREDAIGVK